jgi:hypothetical protein
MPQVHVYLYKSGLCKKIFFSQMLINTFVVAILETNTSNI